MAIGIILVYLIAITRRKGLRALWTSTTRSNNQDYKVQICGLFIDIKMEEVIPVYAGRAIVDEWRDRDKRRA